MRTSAILLLLAALFLMQGCGGAETPDTDGMTDKTIHPPLIRLAGNKTDTAYLLAAYRDKGVTTNEFINDQYRCTDIAVKITGTVNTRLPGTYVLCYDAVDRNGVPAATATRTVHVMENKAGFLSGLYNAACSCTIIGTGTAAGQPTLSSSSYTAVVAPGAINRQFELNLLNIGPEYLVPQTALLGHVIDVGLFSPDYGRSSFTGTLAPSKNSFSITSQVYPYAQPLIYTCINSYTRQLVLDSLRPLPHQ